MESAIPERLRHLHAEEEKLRKKAAEIVAGDQRFWIHLFTIKHTMDLADCLRQFPTNDEDLKLIQILGMRLFNAFGASIKLGLSGYGQNSALIMRDILETVFLLDFFSSNRESIEHWRLASKKERMRNFSPAQVRKALDIRDGLQGEKRAALYGIFSELAGHPTMKSVLMMRPQKDGDAVIGPFIEKNSFEAIFSEMGRLAVQVGEILDRFFPETWNGALEARRTFTQVKQQWITVFYPPESTVPK